MTEKMQFNVKNGINCQDIISEMSTSGSTTDSNITQAKKRKYEQLVSEEPEKFILMRIILNMYCVNLLKRHDLRG